jgi:hypothetical protein
MAGKIARRTLDGSFTTAKSDLSRIDMMLKKKQEVERRLEQERIIKYQKELDGCTFKPQIGQQEVRTYTKTN